MRMGITLVPHGIGRTFCGWGNMLIEHTLPEMQRLRREGMTHVLYVDGRDVIFIAGLAEIMENYEGLGKPAILFSHDDQVPGETWRVNAGCWMGEIEELGQLWTRLSHEYPNDNNPQNWMWNARPDVAVDTACRIFQSVEGGVATNDGRVINVVTGTKPCILHFRGGYCDPVTGREARIKPVLEQLYGAGVM